MLRRGQKILGIPAVRGRRQPGKHSRQNWECPRAPLGAPEAPRAATDTLGCQVRGRKMLPWRRQHLHQHLPGCTLSLLGVPRGLAVKAASPTFDPAHVHKSIISWVQAFPLVPHLIWGGQGRHPWHDGLGVSIVGRQEWGEAGNFKPALLRKKQMMV